MLIGGLLFILALLLAFNHWISKQLENDHLNEEQHNR
jgi:hypothetical protein